MWSVHLPCAIEAFVVATADAAFVPVYTAKRLPVTACTLRIVAAADAAHISRRRELDRRA